MTLRRRFRSAALLGAAALGLPVAGAQAEAPVKGSLYARIGLGAVMAEDFDLDLTPNPASAFIGGPPTTRAYNLKIGVQGAAAVGFAFPSGARTELEYRYARPHIDLITDSNVTVSDIRAANGGVGVHYVMTNVYYDFARTRRFSPYVGVGVGGAFVRDGLQDSDWTLAYQARAGLDYHLGEGVTAGLEYIYTRTRDLTLGPDDFSAPNAGDLRAEGGPLAASSAMVTFRKAF